METVINFLMDNYFYFAGVAFVLILALIGYIIDQRKTDKLKREFAKKQEEDYVLPISAIDGNLKLGAAINKQVENNNVQNGNINTAPQRIELPSQNQANVK